MFDRPPFFFSSKLPPKSLLGPGFVWNSCLFPWYHVSVSLIEQGRVSPHAVMVSTLDELKKLLKQRSDCFTVTSIHYVTPGHMNESGDWKMEPLLEISELFNEEGWSIPRCKVGGNRVYRAMRLEPLSEWRNEQLVFRTDEPSMGASRTCHCGPQGACAHQYKKSGLRL